MLVKEYRIPLPLTLEEYSVAQLYMIQKKSREESEGNDSAVEIIENKPYSDGPRGKGQYTYKIFHIGRHLPSWFRSIAPKSALEVHEESWNAYPYTKTIFSVPYVEKFSIEVETVFEPDNGHQENIFQLRGSDLRQREVDVIDIVKDQLTGNDYKIEEDPRDYVSQKTGRGPLHDDWITNPPNNVIMCAYKLVKVEFRYWGLQSKAERMIHDYGLRRVMLRAHRQAWAWQDEWEGLTIADVRKLEEETKLILQKKLGRVAEEEEKEDEEEEEEVEKPGATNEERRESEMTEYSSERTSNHTESPFVPPSIPSSPPSSAHRHSLPAHTYSPPSSHPPPLNKSISEVERSSLHPSPRVAGLARRMKRDRSNISQHRLTLSHSHSRLEGDSDGDSMYSCRPEWALDSIAITDSDSELEFFDALETASGGGDEEEEDSEEEYEEAVQSGSVIPFSSSMTSISSGEDLATIQGTRDVQETQPVDILMLVVQCGADVKRDSTLTRSIDFNNLQTNLTAVADLHFRSASDRWALRQVPCPDLTLSAYQTLCDVNTVPVSLDSLVMEPSVRPATPPVTSSSVFPTHLPVAVVPLLVTQSPSYSEQLRSVTMSANRVYQEFLHSPEGSGFNGQVCIITDCMGSVVVYDILTSSPPHILSPSPTSPHSYSLGTSSSGGGGGGGGVRRTPTLSSSTPNSPRQLSRHFSEDITSQPKSLSASSRKHSSSLSPLPLTCSSSHSSSSTATLVNSTGFDFDVTSFFSLGSSLGLVLSSRHPPHYRQQLGPAVPPPLPPRPSCTSFYNLSYINDPMSSRVETLLDKRFTLLPPPTIPAYRRHPKGLAECILLKQTVAANPEIFSNSASGRRSLLSNHTLLNCDQSVSKEYVITVEEEGASPAAIHTQSDEEKPFSVWWSRQRLDYLMESPLTSGHHDSLPITAITSIIHSSYWEAKEIVSFILRQVLRHDSTIIVRGYQEEGEEETPFIPHQRIEKWRRKRTAIKIKRLSSSHKVNDVLCVSSGPSPVLQGRFGYGPLGMVSLAKEIVDLFVLVTNRDKSSSWRHMDTMATDKHGKASFTVAERLPVGLYPVKLLIRGDHTTASCNLFVMPPHTEAVVFSVDGALVNNLSLSGRAMKCKAGAVEVASHWRDQGYLLIYLTGRPDVQKDMILKFLAVNGFPLGVVACVTDSITDSHPKTLYLARLIKEAKMIIGTAYGSQRHLAVFTELGLQRDQIYILGRKTGKKEAENCQVIGGYDDHIQDLMSSRQRRALSEVTSLLGGRDVCFALPGKRKQPERGRRRKSRTGSLSPRRINSRLSHKKETVV